MARIGAQLGLKAVKGKSLPFTFGLRGQQPGTPGTKRKDLLQFECRGSWMLLPRPSFEHPTRLSSTQRIDST
jgi:hypothetical protein